MLRTGLAILTILLAMPAAQAETLAQMLKGKGGNSCWQRVYSAPELAAHPKQRVASIRLISEVQEDGSLAASLDLNFRVRTHTWKYDYDISGFCKAHGQGLLCQPEWDAGTFVLEKGARNGLRVRNQKLIVNPSNFDSEEVAPGAVDMSKSDDAVWLLFAAKDDASCSAN